MSYEFDLSYIFAYVNQQDILPTKKNADLLQKISRELSVRLSRLDLEGNNSLWIDRVVDKAEDHLRDINRQLTEHERKHGYMPRVDAEFIEDLK